MFTKTTAYIDKKIEEKKLPLLDVIVYKNNELIYRHCGSYSGAHGENDLLCMFSCSKVLTAVCAMKLIAEGKIALDDPVSKYIPAFEKAYTVDEKGEKHKEVITVRHLFTMSSGFDYKLTTPEILKFAKENYETANTVDLISQLVNSPLHFKPGEKFLYSLSHDALGALIETVEGITLAEYAEKYVFAPLGMKNSTMDSRKYINNPPTNYDILENGYEVEKGNTYKHFHPTKNYVSGGAGLISCVEDQILLADALANYGVGKSGNRILTRAGIEIMRANHLTPEQTAVFSSYDHFRGYSYGYGVRTNINPALVGNLSPVGEFGWDGAKGSYFSADPENRVAIFYAEHMGGLAPVVQPRLRNIIYSCLGYKG